ncbi:hypothetical protein [Alkalihalobacillus sp. TS-13]|uniref:hypothetical protein n=1 Tax=Alkalihalobacillus sp. TS-13 TaxID=2842455 RepID=UPI001C88D354|nr:hypothetical protein [Alkalihalobacillus sp. TS-13]
MAKMVLFTANFADLSAERQASTQSSMLKTHHFLNKTPKNVEKADAKNLTITKLMLNEWGGVEVMTVQAIIQPLDVSRNKEDKDPFYRKLEIHMQRLGHLIPFKEQLNWESPITTIDLGDMQTLQNFRKKTAKNDGVLLIYAKLTKGTIYQHIILHPNNTGIYLPFRFENPFYIPIGDKKIWIGSSVRLLEELGWLELSMMEETDESIVSYWNNLKDACELSVENTTPIMLQTS